jgi:hypothetical protein
MNKALIIGIDHYPDSPLYGCVADARKVSGILEYQGTKAKQRNFECRLIQSEEKEVKIRRAVLRKEIQQFLENESTIGILYFAGHATNTKLEGYFRTQDGEDNDPGVPFSEVVKMINASPIKDLIIVIDACYSGGFGRNLVDGTTQIREGVSILSSSAINQKSKEHSKGGLFTEYFCEALDGGAADIQGNVDVGGIFNYVNTLLGAFDQQPTFKSHAARMAVLNHFEPVVSLDHLRELPRLFLDKDEALELNPSFEPTSEPPNPKPDPENVKIFKVLQALEGAGLVRPVGAEHMYYAAMNSESCKLTSQGKFYWTLASKKKL